MRLRATAVAALAVLAAAPWLDAAIAPDPHSYGNPAQARVTSVALDLEVSFAEKRLKGTATLELERAQPGEAGALVLDTRELTIEGAEAGHDAGHFAPAMFSLDKPDAILGAALRIALPAGARFVRIRYSTSPRASGLQWLEPAQTASHGAPYLYSQSESIHARSWIPLQDSPGVRVTYTARIRVPRGLRAVMSADNRPRARANGEFRFRMDRAIPPYLIALAVGDLEFRATGRRSGVYAEPSIVDRAAREFSDTEKMMAAAERLYGPYRWTRYDILVLPPSFPYGGMENPRLTTVTPTVLAGDKSLVSVIAHELAHSWSGNLVTNATWSDFWLNEGFTTYLERRIQEELYGRQRSEMEAVNEKAELLDEMKPLAPRDTVLHIDLAGRDPDDGSTEVPYGKGMLFLRLLEERFGRARFDQFLRGYFDRFAFQSITTADFEAYLNQHLLGGDANLAADLGIHDWLYAPGLPANTPEPRSAALDRAAHATRPDRNWTTPEWVRFVHALPQRDAADRMAEIDRDFHITESGNDEVLQPWLLRAVENHYEAAWPRLERFLPEVGRLRYVLPLYRALAQGSAEDRARAAGVFEKARAGYHPITIAAVEQVLKAAGR